MLVRLYGFSYKFNWVWMANIRVFFFPPLVVQEENIFNVVVIKHINVNLKMGRGRVQNIKDESSCH
jgi:hypothetical protein